MHGLLCLDGAHELLGIILHCYDPAQSEDGKEQEMDRTRFTPCIGETFNLKDCKVEYTCLKIIGKYEAVLKNRETGWTLTANGIGRYPDGSIDWDFSTDGHFELKE